jgi:hypothetical protein
MLLAGLLMLTNISMLLAQDAAHRQAAAVQDDAGATMSAVQGKVQALEAALAEAHATVSTSSCCCQPTACASSS